MLQLPALTAATPTILVAAQAVRRLSGVIAIVVLLFFLACAPVASAQPAAGPWDPLLPKVASAGAPGDPVAIANASLQATAMATQTAMSMGRNFLSSLGLVSPAADPSTSVRGNRVNGAQAIEYVIRRAGTQIGVPYSWGGGSLTGPSRGVDQGAGTVGFDCSGLTRFAFAGVGVLLPRWSGDQYDAGRKVPPSQAKRGRSAVLGARAGASTKLSISAAGRCSRHSRPACQSRSPPQCARQG